MKAIAALLTALLCTACNRPAPAPVPDKPPAPQAGSAAAQLHAPLEKARAVEGTLQQAEHARHASPAATQ